MTKQLKKLTTTLKQNKILTIGVLILLILIFAIFFPFAFPKLALYGLRPNNYEMILKDFNLLNPRYIIAHNPDSDGGRYLFETTLERKYLIFWQTYFNDASRTNLFYSYTSNTKEIKSLLRNDQKLTDSENIVFIEGSDTAKYNQDTVGDDTGFLTNEQYDCTPLKSTIDEPRFIKDFQEKIKIGMSYKNIRSLKKGDVGVSQDGEYQNRYSVADANYVQLVYNEFGPENPDTPLVKAEVIYPDCSSEVLELEEVEG